MPMPYYLGLSSLIFAIALIGIFLNRRNVILVLLCVELMLLAGSINFIAFAKHTDTVSGQVIALFILAVAAAETAIGLAILVVYYRLRATIEVDDISQLRG